MQHDGGHTLRHAGVHVCAPDEGNEEIGCDGPARSAPAGVAERGGERPRSHDAHGPQAAGGRHCARELAARHATAHPGLDDRMLESKSLAQSHDDSPFTPDGSAGEQVPAGRHLLAMSGRSAAAEP